MQIDLDETELRIIDYLARSAANGFARDIANGGNGTEVFKLVITVRVLVNLHEKLKAVLPDVSNSPKEN